MHLVETEKGKVVEGICNEIIIMMNHLSKLNGGDEGKCGLRIE